MLRKTVMALAACATLALAAAPTEASARAWAGHGWGGWHGAWHGGWHRFGVRRFGFFPHRRFFVRGYPYYYAYGGCWRWAPGPWGPHRVWVCGYRPYAWRY
ncbi:MAG TPA: sulfur globule protein precursor [Xanthobacteraceae bacterium]|jgi:hypothetical protein|nr:sulfur globule protein precursor [Xanthobacteraceae bacterium]